MSKNELVFLGTGPAWGTPVLNCTCPACIRARNGNDPRDTRQRTALYLVINDEKFLIDAGPDIRAQLQRENVTKVDHLLLTHSHADHINGLDELTPLVTEDAPIPTYASDATWAIVERRFNYLTGRVLERHPALHGVELIGPKCRVTPFAVEHGPTAPGSLGFIFEWDTRNGERAKLMYTGDFFDVPWPDARLSGADTVVMESNWFNEPAVMPSSWHMSFQRARRFIKQWAPKEVFLVHMSHEDNTRTAKAPLTQAILAGHQCWQDQVSVVATREGLPQITVAFDGLRVPLP